MTDVTILTGPPTIVVLAEQKLDGGGVLQMAEWVKQHRPKCVPEGGFQTMWDLLPHSANDVPHDSSKCQYCGVVGPVHAGDKPCPVPLGRRLSDNEVLAELAGRKCYDSFADAAGRKTNRDYMEHIFSTDPIHSSILYHAKMTFFFAGVSRKFSHQFIRNYVGSDRDEEGSPSQESTRFTHHYGFYVVVPPYVLSAPLHVPSAGADAALQSLWLKACQRNYDAYTEFIEDACSVYRTRHGTDPKGGDRKDIYEAAAGLLNMSAETSFVWTTNPMAIRKFLKERCHAAADAEIYRFALHLAKLCFERWPNLFLGKDLDDVRSEVAEAFP